MRLVRKDGTVKLAVVATVFLMGASVWGQDAPAASSQDQSGSQGAQPSGSEYGGPSLLDRGEAPSVLRGGDFARLTPYLGVTGIYYSDVTGTAVDALGSPIYQPGYGVSAMFGITGTHKWSRSELDLEYHGYYTDFTQVNQERGFDNSLNLTFQHQLRPRLSLTLTENLARVRRPYSLPLGMLYGGGTSGFNPLYNGLTANNLLNAPTLASVSGARLAYQLTARWSVSAGGTGIVSRQNLTQTIGVNGYVADGDIAYRLSRYQTISFGYSFTHFGYVGQFGQTDIHGVGLSYSVRLGRYWELGASAGVSRAESLGDLAVTLDPVLAQLLGFDTVFEKVHDVFYMPTGALHLTRSFRHSSWTANYSRSVIGGQGLYTTSTYETAALSYSYWGLRRLSLDAGAGYFRYSALNESLGRYRSFGASGGFSVPMGKGFSSIGRIDWRHTSVSDSLVDRQSSIASLGIAWSPRGYPVSLW